jgi:serine/threonine protein kinase
VDLGICVSKDYRELIYDVAIQLATALDFAHSSGLVHGKFDLSCVVIDEEKKNHVFKIQDFAPGTSMKLPISTEAAYWPFSKKKQNLSDREKLEVLMLKDIYSLGICILEMMIGRTSKQKFSISLNSLPLTWAEFPESTPLI